MKMKIMQLKFKNLLLLLMLGLIFSGCSSDDDFEVGLDPEPDLEPIILDCSTITEATVLENRSSGIDYICPCILKVEAPLTIEPGVTIAFEQGGGMNVKDYGERTGSITAIGTEDMPIVFTGTNQVPGAWGQLHISSEDLNNKLYYTIIEYAGATDGSKPAITTTGDSKVEIQNTIIRNNKGDGVFVHARANIENWKKNTITDNQGYPIETAARKIKFLDGNQSTYTNNGENVILVNSRSIYNRGFIEDEIGGPIHTWLDSGIPYYVVENIFVRKDRSNEIPGHLKITEGCEIIFAEEYGIQVYHTNPILQILGTPENPVKLSGENGIGSWKGINIKGSSSTLNTIENATIADAGQSNWNWFSGEAGLSLGSQTGATINLNMNNVHITNSAGCGVIERKLTAGSTISYNNVTYSSNTGNDICTEI